MEKVSVCKAGFALCRGAFLHVSKCVSKQLLSLPDGQLIQRAE